MNNKNRIRVGGGAAFFAALCLFTCFFVPATRAQPTVFIVRHAEKETASAGDTDPKLSEAGRERSERLARVLRDAGIRAVYASEFRRTQETAAPMAKALGLDVTIIPATDVPPLIARLREFDGSVLVVGHSNTVPQIMRALGVDETVNLAETDFDNLFLVLPGAPPRLLRLHY